jgi:hypothetical protein
MQIILIWQIIADRKISVNPLNLCHQRSNDYSKIGKLSGKQCLLKYNITTGIAFFTISFLI